MSVADYRRRITLMQRQMVQDDEGMVTEQWVDVATVWAAVEPILLKSREFFAAAAVNAENSVLFRIRYRHGITSDMRIRYDSRVFNINAIADVETRHRELQIRAVEVTTGGS